MRISRRALLAGSCSALAPISWTGGNGVAAASGQDPRAFQDIFGAPSRGRIVLDARTYDLTEAIAWNLSDVVVRGVPGKTRLRTNHRTVLYFSRACRNVVFEDIIFETANANSAEQSYFATVLSDNFRLTNIKFIRCGFTARHYRGDTAVFAGVNAFKLIAEARDAVIEQFHILEPVIDGYGAMGVEVQNHAGDGVQRYFDVQISGGLIRDTGLSGTHGQGVSLSGPGSDCKINSVFDNCRYAAIENVGASNSVFSGRSRNLTRSCGPLMFTNTTPMADCVIEDFQCLDRANGDVRLENMKGVRLQGNRLSLSGRVVIQDVEGLRASDEAYLVGALPGLLIQSTSGRVCKNNEWVRTVIEATGTDRMQPLVQFFGSGTRQNRLIGPTLRGVGPLRSQNVNGAELNSLT